MNERYLVRIIVLGSSAVGLLGCGQGEVGTGGGGGAGGGAGGAGGSGAAGGFDAGARLARDTAWPVRRAVAQNRVAPTDLVGRLVRDSVPRVREAAEDALTAYAAQGMA